MIHRTPVERLIEGKPTEPPKFAKGQKVRTSDHSVGMIHALKPRFGPEYVRDEYGIYMVAFRGIWGEGDEGVRKFFHESELEAAQHERTLHENHPRPHTRPAAQ